MITTRRMSASGCAFAIATVGALLLSSFSLAAAGPSGSAAGIAVARSVVKAYQSVSVESYVEHGFIFMAATEGKQSSFKWEYGVGPYLGLSPATEHAEVGLQNGRVKWWVDDLNPGTCSAAGPCARIPVELVADSKGLFYAFGDSASHTCYGHLSGTAPVRVGQPVWYVSGSFEPPKKSGANELVTSTYPYSIPGAQPSMATEVDKVAAASGRLLATNVTITAQPGHQLAPFSFGSTFTYPTTAPQPPVVNLC